MSRPLSLSQRAVDDLRLVAIDLRPAVLEQLSRISANFATCSRPTSFPRPPGLESGLWCRSEGGTASLVEVLFELRVDPESILVRRVLISTLPKLPDWVIRPDEWSAHAAWPIVEL